MIDLGQTTVVLVLASFHLILLSISGSPMAIPLDLSLSFVRCFMTHGKHTVSTLLLLYSRQCDGPPPLCS